MNGKGNYDVVLGPDILGVDTSKGDVVVTIPQFADDDCVVMHNGQVVFYDWGADSFPDLAFSVDRDKKAVATEVENIELKKRVKELERELNILLKGRIGEP